MSLAPLLPGWKLALGLSDAASFDTAANARTAFFLWTGVVVVAITAALALLVANMLREQSRLTRLKNDLVATVSHELKTPLASIRLLVDTLLDADGSPGAPFGDPTRAREYLEMIATENSRLSRLIDNFLTFSRMERGKHRFEFQPDRRGDDRRPGGRRRGRPVRRRHEPAAASTSSGRCRSRATSTRS